MKTQLKAVENAIRMEEMRENPGNGPSWMMWFQRADVGDCDALRLV